MYAVGHRALTPRAHELAAVLACGPGALLSHRTAGALWGLLGTPGRIEVTVPRSSGPRKGLVVHRSRVIHVDDRAVVNAIPATSVARTLVDLADVLSERRLADAVHESEVLRLFDLTAVGAALERLAGRPGRHRLRRVLAAYSERPDTKSKAERRFLGILARQGLPAPLANAPVGGYTLDCFWPHAALAVEVDGAGAHNTRRAFQRDRERDRRLGTIGIQVVRVSWRDLEDEARLAAELKAIRARRLGR